ncbi:MAG: hypothetical protein IJS96_06930 [Schwartzia sp.]|nr:hypothetical protein [Schwartzia sp. (in: firmicutes)]
MAEDRRKPTTVQLEYARHLINELGYDPDWYDVESMTRLKLANLIDDLRKELEG